MASVEYFVALLSSLPSSGTKDVLLEVLGWVLPRCPVSLEILGYVLPTDTHPLNPTRYMLLSMGASCY